MLVTGTKDGRKATYRTAPIGESEEVEATGNVEAAGTITEGAVAGAPEVEAPGLEFATGGGLDNGEALVVPDRDTDGPVAVDGYRCGLEPRLPSGEEITRLRAAIEPVALSSVFILVADGRRE